jgi:eukaryotic-like serine/threonine-protein kinase
LSPDGNWLAYESDESGRNEVYLQRVPHADGARSAQRPGRLLVSTQGGMEPRWRRDGRELYYLNANGYMMATDVRPGPAGLEATVPRALFEVRAVGYNRYDVTADGQRFLVNVPVQTRYANAATIVLNWTSALK